MIHSRAERTVQLELLFEADRRYYWLGIPGRQSQITRAITGSPSRRLLTKRPLNHWTGLVKALVNSLGITQRHEADSRGATTAHGASGQMRVLLKKDVT
jgi:hypothetical protein